MSFVLQKAGTYTLLVDLGRPGARHLGVPLGGAADAASYKLANALAGNAEAVPALEIALAGPVLQAKAAHAVAIVGAPFSIWLNDKAMSSQRVLQMEAGDTLRIGSPLRRGARCYLATPGGFTADRVLESASSMAPLAAGVELACEPSRSASKFVRLSAKGSLESINLLRFLPGRHGSARMYKQMESKVFRVLPESNRMGLRIQGDPRVSVSIEEQLSEPVVPGTIQLPPNGQPIILGIDAQTIGGYPRIAHIIKADWDKLAQLVAGDEVRFAQVDQEEAGRLWERRAEWLHDWTLRFLISAERKLQP